MNIVVSKDKNNIFDKYFNTKQNKSLLKFLTCGSVDDGKSTLIGCLLHETKHVYDDQLLSLYQDSRRHGTQGNDVDFALLVDGLQAEREQGITIDVAYRYFSTNKRKFIIADTPGHIQYTRNMVTGASNSSLAVLLIDARKGILEQTRRHTFISNLLGIKHLIIIINKMDLVDYNEIVFKEICKNFCDFLNNTKFKLEVCYIPVSALLGENIVVKSINMPWYIGDTLLQILENIIIPDVSESSSLIFPVQYVNRPNLDFRGYSGTIASGTIHVGKKVQILPSGLHTSIKKIITFDGNLSIAKSSQPISLVLNDNIDISRGDVIVDVHSMLKPVREVCIDIVWMSETPLCLKKNYLIKVAGKKSRVYIKNILYKRDINTFKKQYVESLYLNDIACVNVIFDELLIVDTYKSNAIMGGLIFIDPISNHTIAAGMIKNLIVSKYNDNYKNIDFFKLELNSLICRYFPEWETKSLTNMEDKD
ncbi:Sulfate adenylyltransferase subunit 1 [Buchnera aphidicola (Eriosoma lanigerum)]|uniref:sulfate adenylyltransferase subunit CysN n=1 Tax=Buchnera aphidicola TaxID=9 RepID=UPI003464E7B4